jgi:hypothetical protein
MIMISPVPYKRIAVVIAGVSLSLFLAVFAKAQTVPVTWSVNAPYAEGEDIMVYTPAGASTPILGGAGIFDLTVNGAATEGFCLDPFVMLTYTGYTQGGTQEILGNYTESQLTNPTIEALMATYYVEAQDDTTGLDAAALQIAIWETVKNDNYSFLDLADSTTNSAKIEAATMIANASGSYNLIELNSSPSGNQPLMIPGSEASVPDGGPTVALLGLAMAALAGFRRKFHFC